MILFEGETGDLFPEVDRARWSCGRTPPRRDVRTIEALALYMGCSVSQVVLRNDGSWTSGASAPDVH